MLPEQNWGWGAEDCLTVHRHKESCFFLIAVASLALALNHVQSHAVCFIFPEVIVIPKKNVENLRDT